MFYSDATAAQLLLMQLSATAADVALLIQMGKFERAMQLAKAVSDTLSTAADIL